MLGPTTTALEFRLITTAVDFCNFGKNIKTIAGFQNQSCSSGELHILSMFFEKEQQTTLTSAIDKHDNGHSFFTQSTANSLDTKKYFCYIFRYIAVHPLPDDTTHEYVIAEYGCDFSNYCVNRTVDQVLNNVTINNQTGKLYCCSKENCNDLDKVHAPSENRICHEGTQNLTSILVGGLKSCHHPDAACAKSTLYMPDGKIESYFCDNENQCSSALISSGAFKTCANKTVDNVTSELCCCDQNKCYSPPWLIPSHPVEELHPENAPPVAKMDKTIEKPGDGKSDSLLITGLLTVLLFVCGLAAGAVFILTCKKRRKNRQDPNVIMQYERLSSDIDIDEAVVL
ncbi:hypothetical protein Btru_076355 [Bulinus truncatus]|nr:hypothetical protein Btru_076355 [Bulinus truncatus]